MQQTVHLYAPFLHFDEQKDKHTSNWSYLNVRLLYPSLENEQYIYVAFLF